MNLQIQRATLQAYINTNLQDINITERQKEAVSKMLFLNAQQFEELVTDISDEIARRQTPTTPYLPRTSGYSAKRNSSRVKLSRLDINTFKNLVIDTLLVLNHRSPQTDNNPILANEFIDKIEHLIQDLKGDAKTYEDVVIQNIREQRQTLNRIRMYNQYIRNMFVKHGEDAKVINFFESLMVQEFDQHKKSEFEAIFDIDEFLKQSNRYFEDYGCYVEEYEYHRNNIHILNQSIKNNEDHSTEESQLHSPASQTQESVILNPHLNQDVCKKLIVKEAAQICQLLFTITNLQQQYQSTNIEPQISHIIKSLEDLKVCIHNQPTNAKLLEIAEAVAHTCNTLIKKIETRYSNPNFLEEIILERDHIEECIRLNKMGKEGEDIQDVIFKVCTAVKNVLTVLPNA